MKIIQSILLVALVASLLTINAKQLLQTSVSWNDGSISYPKGKPEVTAIKQELKENQVIDFHCHLVPTFVYILKGSVEVETKSGKKAIFTEGDSMLEVMNTIHKGTAIGGPTDILVFFAGAKSKPHTVAVGSKEAQKHCN